MRVFDSSAPFTVSKLVYFFLTLCQKPKISFLDVFVTNRLKPPIFEGGEKTQIK